MAEERENQKANIKPEPDVEGHGNFPLLDDTDPDEAKLKLANDEDDDVEAHNLKANLKPYQTGG